jgi:membrane-associated phospholipid phosphatase
MKPIALAVLAVVAATRVGHADPHDDRHRIRRAVGLAAAAGIYVTWETVAKPHIAPLECRWCSTGSFDVGMREIVLWDHPKDAATLSNLTGYVAAPLTAAGMLLIASRGRADRFDTLTDDLTAVAEAAMYTQLAVQVFKYSFGRERPYAHYMTGVYTPGPDDDLSFISGHSALVFSIATAAGMVAHQRHSRLEPAIWATGMALAVTTAYLRIAADKHYFTDVVAGSSLGIVGGLLIPLATGSLPRGLEAVPTGNGLAIAGTF